MITFVFSPTFQSISVIDANNASFCWLSVGFSNLCRRNETFELNFCLSNFLIAKISLDRHFNRYGFLFFRPWTKEKMLHDVCLQYLNRSQEENIIFSIQKKVYKFFWFIHFVSLSLHFLAISNHMEGPWRIGEICKGNLNSIIFFFIYIFHTTKNQWCSSPLSSRWSSCRAKNCFTKILQSGGVY